MSPSPPSGATIDVASRAHNPTARTAPHARHPANSVPSRGLVPPLPTTHSTGRSRSVFNSPAGVSPPSEDTAQNFSLSMKKKFASKPGILTLVTRPFSDAAPASGGSTRRTRCRPDRPSRSTARRPDRCRCASRRDSRGGRLRPVGRRRREERCRSAVGSSSASA